MSNYIIRRYQPGDEVGIAEAHRESIRRIVAKDYAPQQIDVWAGRIAPEKYVDSMQTKGETFWVLDDNGTIGGFAGWVPGCMYGFYMHPDYAGKGLARRLFEAAEKDMMEHTPSNTCDIDATITARPFYERMGFEVVEQAKHTFGNGTVIDIFKMRKTYQPEPEQTK
ncbi:MAG: GNAT family N-acetyltransferase [Pseudomonadaceae bacterium]|nr:GNAT family N-acetyltransferase [Pseudomonadaceae bacterium]